MWKINNNQALLILNKLIEEAVHKYPTKFTESCFSLKAFSKPSWSFSWSKNLE